jgi:Predicted metal-binding integral membrane protein (DUF2182)
MDRIQKIIFISIISIAAISWVLSIDQPDMMAAMMNYNPVAISLFVVSWTIGMAAMMFPAITPMVLLYNRLIKRSNSSNDCVKMRQNQIIDFRIIRDMPCMNLTGYIEFLLMVAVNKSAYREIIEKMYREMQEYLMSRKWKRGNYSIISLLKHI